MYYCIKNVEFYGDNDYIEFLCMIINEKEGEGVVRERFKRMFPRYELIDITDGDCMKIWDMTTRQFSYVERGMILSDKPLYWRDLE